MFLFIFFLVYLKGPKFRVLMGPSKAQYSPANTGRTVRTLYSIINCSFA